MDQSFQDRLASIGEKRGAQLHVGGEVVSVERTAPVRVSRRKEIATNALYPLSFVGAFLLGITAVFASLFIRGTLLGFDPYGEMGDTYLIINGGLAAGASFVIAQMFRLNSKPLATAQLVGIWVMLTLVHNLAHSAPDLATTLFSADWVKLQHLRTEPNTLVFRGFSFQL